MTADMKVFHWLPCPVVFICTTHNDQRDIMTGTAMFVSEKEPLLTISVATGNLTEKLINASGTFVLALAADTQSKLAIQLGSAKGDQVDKYARFAVDTLPENVGHGLVPEGVSAWMTCQVESDMEIKGYRVFTGRVNAGEDLGLPPLVWCQDAFWKLASAK